LLCGKKPSGAAILLIDETDASPALRELGSPSQDAALAKLGQERTPTETRFPTTALRVIYGQTVSVEF